MRNPILITIFLQDHGIYPNTTDFGPILVKIRDQNMKTRIRKAPDQHREVPDDPKLIFECQEIIIFTIFKPTQIHQEVTENTLRQPKIHQSVSLQRSPRSEGNVLVCVWKVMVRSTLLRLDLRGALRAFLGGPLVTRFFRR